MNARENLARLGREILSETAGGALVAIGLYNFAIAANLPLTGFSGIAYMIHYVSGFPMGWSLILLNVPVAVLCCKVSGRRFFSRSLRCMVISSLMIDYLAPLFPVYRGDRLLAALSTGLVAGLGYAIIYACNSSTGGLDFIIMAIRAWNPHIPLGRITFVLDIVVILAESLLFQDVDGFLYGIMVSFLLSVVVDKVIFGINMGKVTLIVTDKGDMICELIEETCHRGSTILKSIGGYSKTEKQVVMCACSTKQMYTLKNTMKEADPQSFMVILDSYEVYGDGFRMLEIGNPDFTKQ